MIRPIFDTFLYESDRVEGAIRQVRRPHRSEGLSIRGAEGAKNIAWKWTRKEKSQSKKLINSNERIILIEREIQDFASIRNATLKVKCLLFHSSDIRNKVQMRHRSSGLRLRARLKGEEWWESFILLKRKRQRSVAVMEYARIPRSGEVSL